MPNLIRLIPFLMFIAKVISLPSSFVPRTRLVAFSQQRRQCTSFRRSSLRMMPEGPEVRTLVDQLQGSVGMKLKDLNFLSGRYVRGDRPKGFADFAATMTQTVPDVDIIQAWKCKGKFMYIILDDGAAKQSSKTDTTIPEGFQRSIWITLGMTGRFVNAEVHAKTTNREARWSLDLLEPQTKKRRSIYYYDTRNFGTLRFCTSEQELEDKLHSLGPDIFNMNEDDFVSLVASRKRDKNVCKFLMDQSILAGIGNYILSEGLYRSSVDPFGTVKELDEDSQRCLFRELQSVTLESYKSQGMTREAGGEYRTIEGDSGQFSFQLQCYGRDICAKGRPVQRERDGPHGRTIWYTEEQLRMPRREREQLEKITDPLETNEDDGNTPEEHLKDVAKTLTEESWLSVVGNEFTKDYFGSLLQFLETERKSGAIVYPPQNKFFAALNYCPVSSIKVVIVGQDPYHGPNQGHGLAFSVQRHVPPPPSLKNIFREAVSDVGIREPKNGNLESWAKQGVLLLNSVLTVRQGEANSHRSCGWEEFTDAVIAGLNEQSEGLVFLLWGNPAHKKAANVDSSKHFVIRTSHPSPLGATKTASPFLGSRCFSRANAALADMGKTQIDWNVS